MQRTPDNQIEMATRFCQIMEEHEVVSECMVNDYGRYGNFDIFVYPEKIERSTTNKIKKAIRLSIEKVQEEFKDDEDSPELHLRQVNPATAIRKWCKYDEKTKIIGYDRNFWTVDLDFKVYLGAEINEFA